jgi:hypothetical protein
MLERADRIRTAQPPDAERRARPIEPPEAAILALQRSAGNAAVARMLARFTDVETGESTPLLFGAAVEELPVDSAQVALDMVKSGRLQATDDEFARLQHKAGTALQAHHDEHIKPLQSHDASKVPSAHVEEVGAADPLKKTRTSR